MGQLKNNDRTNTNLRNEPNHTRTIHHSRNVDIIKGNDLHSRNEQIMSTLKQKLKKIPSPIREMIVENTNDRYGDWKGYADTGNIGNAFIWQSAKHIPDAEF